VGGKREGTQAAVALNRFGSKRKAEGVKGRAPSCHFSFAPPPAAIIIVFSITNAGVGGARENFLETESRNGGVARGAFLNIPPLLKHELSFEFLHRGGLPVRQNDCPNSAGTKKSHDEPPPQ